MDTNVIDLTTILTHEHEQKGVVLSRDNKTVVAFDADLVTLDQRVGDKDVVFMKVPRSDVYLILIMEQKS